MAILALDTSAAVAVAVTDDAGAVLASRSVAEQRRHAELLAPMITQALAQAGVDRRELTAVVVGTGPAPFTGLRVGLVTARTLGLALGVPVHGVSSLAAIALAAPGTDDVLVVTDARRREVYWARYGRGAAGLTLQEGPGVGPAAEAALAGEGARVVGPALALYPAAFGGSDPAVDAPGDRADGPRPAAVDPAALVRVALAALADPSTPRPLPTEPLYLRRPDAVPAAERKRATG